VADLNGDGRPDLVTANRDSNTVSLLLGQGNGTFQAKEHDVGNGPASVAVADLNGDGHPDLVTANFDSSDVSLLLGQGDGTFQVGQRFAVGNGPAAVAVADLNGDGRPDLVTANFDSSDVSLLLGQGNGTFRAEERFAVGFRPASVAVADFNGDGRLDLVTANRDADTVSVLLGQGAGTFRAEERFAVGVRPASVAVADFNGDGRLDLVTANRNSNDVSVRPGQVFNLSPGRELKPVTVDGRSQLSFIFTEHIPPGRDRVFTVQAFPPNATLPNFIGRTTQDVDSEETEVAITLLPVDNTLEVVPADPAMIVVAGTVVGPTASVVQFMASGIFTFGTESLRVGLTENVTWTSSNTAVATVNNGEAALLSPGMTTITATVEGSSAGLILVVK
jgi:hypothetical protein